MGFPFPYIPKKYKKSYVRRHNDFIIADFDHFTNLQ